MNELIELAHKLPPPRKPSGSGLAFLVEHAFKAAEQGRALALESKDEQTEACRRLFAAKLLRHVTDLYLYERSGKVRYVSEGMEAAKWIFLPSDDDEVASFEWICALLNLSPAAIRKNIWSKCENYRSVAAKKKSNNVISELLAHAEAVAQENVLAVADR